jgi:uroporphyrinogen decarboxylase
MVTAGWVMGITDLMMGLVSDPAPITRFLENVTTTIIRWLHAQLEQLRQPEGILLLDDIVGMVSEEHYREFVAPHLQRIFNEFAGLIRIYHNDTPCAHLYPALTEAGFDVFNFSHKADIAEVKAIMGHRVALMGNVPPLDVGVRAGPAEVAHWAKTCLDKAAPGGGLILSLGGGVSPDMPAENIDAMLAAARAWSAPPAGPPSTAEASPPTVKATRRPRPANR